MKELRNLGMGCGFLVLAFSLSCLSMSSLWWMEIPFQLALGWLVYLTRVLPQVRVNGAAVLTAALCLVALACGLHLFLGWLQAQRPRPEAEGPSPPWRLRWTLSLLGVVVLMFVAGIAAVGVTHQTAWLLTSPEPWVKKDGIFWTVSERITPEGPSLDR